MLTLSEPAAKLTRWLKLGRLDVCSHQLHDCLPATFESYQHGRYKSAVLLKMCCEINRCCSLSLLISL